MRRLNENLRLAPPRPDRRVIRLRAASRPPGAFRTGGRRRIRRERPAGAPEGRHFAPRSRPRSVRHRVLRTGKR